MNSKRIAIVGARGMANYGGFETLVSEIAPRLRARGYEVLCSSRWAREDSRKSDYRGATPIFFPLRFPSNPLVSRVFELFFDWYFVLKCSFALKCDVIYCLGTGAAFALPLGRLSKSRFVVNIDGLEWKRTKFSAAEQGLIKLLFYISYLSSDVILIDNRELAGFIPGKFHKKIEFIPYGVDTPDCSSAGRGGASWGKGSMGFFSVGKKYWLVVARLEPDNNIHLILKAYTESETKLPLLVVGSFSSRGYEEQVSRLSKGLPQGKQILFAGSVYDQHRLTLIRCGAYAYVHGHSVGGTNPSLLEAMGVGNAILAHDNVFNRNVCADAALFFADHQELAEQMDKLESKSDLAAMLGARARAIAKEKYGWEMVADSYDRLFVKD